MLQKTNPDPSAIARAVATIERNALAQQRVVEDLLDISRIVTGKLQMNSQDIDLRSVITGAVEVVTGAAAKKSLAVRVSVPSDPCLVSGDAIRLQQAVWNLLSNSVKFTPGGGSLDIILSHESPNFAITVRDNGIGIRPEFLPRVFDRFQQADSSTTREHMGLGLGLAIVQEIAVLHGGSVSASSPGPGAGATFTLLIPEIIAPSSPSLPAAVTSVYS